MSRRWMIVLIALAVGCGRETPKVSVAPPPEKQTPETQPDKTKPDPKPAARPTIYPARDLAKVLDLAALPAIEGSKFSEKLASRLDGSAPASVKEIVAFYQAKLSALGWTPAATADKLTDELGSLNFAKDGHLAHLQVINVGKNQSIFSVIFYGNFDATTLPRREGSALLFASPTLANYLSSHPIPDEAAWLTLQLAAQGWQPFTAIAPATTVGKDAHLSFRKQGYVLKAFVSDSTDPRTQEKKTSVQMSIAVLSHELPAPPTATDVRFDDHGWQMRCDAAGDVKTVGEWYQKAMPAAGYVRLPSDEPKAKSWTLRFGTDAGDVVMVSLSAAEQVTRVHVYGVPKAVLDKIK